MLVPPSLIQRAEIRSRPKDYVRQTFRKEVYLDFMGSMEFQLGPARSLNIIGANLSEFQVSQINIIQDGKSLFLFHRFSADDLARYKDYLSAMRTDKLPLKERSNFFIVPPTFPRTTNFWWDIENHAMWSFDEEFVRLLPVLLTLGDPQPQKVDPATFVQLPEKKP